MIFINCSLLGYYNNRKEGLQISKNKMIENTITDIHKGGIL